MSASLASLHGALAGTARRRLVARARLDAPLGLARAQVSARAAVWDGAAWTELAANQARFAGGPRRLLVEGQRTNGIRNPRCEGAAAGTPGTLPSFWSASVASGLTREVVGVGTEAGIPYVDLRVFGTAGGTAGSAQLALSMRFDATSAALAHTQGQQAAVSCFLRCVAGTMPAHANGTNVGFEELNSSRAGVSSWRLTTVPVSTTLARRIATLTAQNALCAFASPILWVYAAGGDAVDFTLRIGAPQIEHNVSFASTPILPPVGSPQAATRGADLVVASLAALFPGGGGTVLWSGVVPQAAPAAADQVLFQLNGADDTNRLVLRNLAGGTACQLASIRAGTATTAALGSVAAGTLFAAGLSFDAAGRAAACLRGGTVQALAGVPTGLAQLRLGSNAAGLAAMFAETVAFDTLPFAVPDAALPGLVANLPL